MVLTYTVLVIALAAAAATGLRPVRVAVFGGTGYLGSRVCRTLQKAGVEVVAVSRSGAPTKVTPSIDYIKHDLLYSSSIDLGRVDCAVCCVGHMRPSPVWEGFFGLHYDDEALEIENGLTTEMAVELARLAGAKKFVYVSLWSLSKYGLYGGIEGYVVGKLRGEKAVREKFDERMIIGPHLICGDTRWKILGKLLRINTSTPLATGYNRLVRSLKNAATGFWPQDAISEVMNTPPSDVDDVARAVAAAALNVTLALNQEPAFSPSGDELLPPLDDVIDGVYSIQQAASQATDDVLKSAAENMSTTLDDDLPYPSQSLTPPFPSLPSSFVPAPSSSNLSQNDALFGSKPLLYPIPPAFTVILFFVGLILLSYQNAPP